VVALSVAWWLTSVDHKRIGVVRGSRPGHAARDTAMRS
jgi:hypothetical protein